jgi:glucose/arabinose dehydrogenase
MAVGARLIVVLTLLAAAGCRSSSSDGGSTGNPPNPPNPPNPNSGLDQRPSNLTCLAPALNSSAGGTVALAQVFASLAFSEPLAMLQAPGDSSRWFVLQKTGRVRAFQNTPNVASFDTDFINLPVAIPAFNAGGEGGLLGMAFHPDYASNRFVYLSWTEGAPMVSVVARFTSNNGGLTLDTGTRMDIIRVNQPSFTNHKGGQIGFGPDGYLYFGLGDGGSGGDPQGHGQDTTDVLGDMLRIDVNGAAPYAIPATNPFFTTPGAKCPADQSSTTNCPEIYASGLRNPWRWSFDRATGELWLGDVGQGAREEIDYEPPGSGGRNYGWKRFEGTTLFDAGTAAPNAVGPIHEYSHADGCSVTGGVVYRGTAIPGLRGTYLFADYCSGRIWGLRQSNGRATEVGQLRASASEIVAFGVDDRSEVYLASLGGTVFQLVPG